MSDETRDNPGMTTENTQAQTALHRVRLPGFITDEEVGLGDVIKRATSAVGIRPCDDCAKRAAMLNRWMAFSGRRSNKS